MQRADVILHLKKYVVSDVLDGNDIGLDERTPLLSWGIINSLEMMKLLTFIYKQFNVEIPVDSLIPDNFTDLASIANLVSKNMVPAT